MINKIKNIWLKICLAYYIIKSENNFTITDSCLHPSIKNLDLTSNGNNYICLENKDGGFDIVYIPYNLGKKCFTFTVSRLNGMNAGKISDATLNILNDHTISGVILGDSVCQPKPTNYIEYTKEVDE